MSLNIKDPEAHRLAEAIARSTEKSMTAIVIEALRERFGEIQIEQRKASEEELLTIASRVSDRVKHPYQDHADLLYDERDHPK